MLNVSLIYHYDWQLEKLQTNHVFLQSSMIHRNRLEVYNDSVVIKYPWKTMERYSTPIYWDTGKHSNHAKVGAYKK